MCVYEQVFVLGRLGVLSGVKVRLERMMEREKSVRCSMEKIMGNYRTS